MDDPIESFITYWRDAENWGGSGYELGLEYPPSVLDRTTRQALLRFIWADPLLRGAAAATRDISSRWQDWDSATPVSGKHYYGYIRVGLDRYVGCGCCFIDTTAATWLVLYLPYSMLERVFDVAYPVAQHPAPWRDVVFDALIRIAARAYARFPYRLGVLGEEASAVLSTEDITVEQVLNGDDLLIPKALFEKMGIPPSGVKVAGNLWFTGHRIA